MKINWKQVMLHVVKFVELSCLFLISLDTFLFYNLSQ